MKIKLNGRTINHESAKNSHSSPYFEGIADTPKTETPSHQTKTHHTPAPTVRLYRLYLSDDIKAVCRGDINCLIEETSHKISTPDTNASTTPYYWRVDTVLNNGDVMEGRIWSI